MFEFLLWYVQPIVWIWLALSGRLDRYNERAGRKKR